MKRHSLTTLIVILGIIILAQSVMAGGKGGQFGIGLSVTETSPSFFMKYWIDKNLTVESEFGYYSVKTNLDNKATEYIAGLGLLYHFSPKSNIRPFIGLRIKAHMAPVDKKTYTDLYKIATMGCEYFVTKRFSITGEYQIQFVNTDEQFSPSWLIPDANYTYTSQMLSVHFYFSKGK